RIGAISGPSSTPSSGAIRPRRTPSASPRQNRASSRPRRGSASTPDTCSASCSGWIRRNSTGCTRPGCSSSGIPPRRPPVRDRVGAQRRTAGRRCTPAELVLTASPAGVPRKLGRSLSLRIPRTSERTNLNLCVIVDNPETTTHPVIAVVLHQLSARHTLRLLDVLGLTGPAAIAREAAHAPADLYLLKFPRAAGPRARLPPRAARCHGGQPVGGSRGLLGPPADDRAHAPRASAMAADVELCHPRTPARAARPARCLALPPHAQKPLQPARRPGSQAARRRPAAGPGGPRRGAVASGADHRA